MKADLIGFVGIGRMGTPMAKRLMAAGHNLIVYDQNTAAMQELVAAGARGARSLAEVASEADMAFLSLPTPEIVRAVTLGQGSLASGGKLKAVIDLSTTGPRMAAEVGEELARKGIGFVDCPVSGGVAGAVKGSLALMAACERALFDETLPLLQQIGKPVYVGSKPGMAQTLKVLNNLMSVTALAIASEALVLGTKAGLDPDVMIEVINIGSGRNTATTDKIPKHVLPRTFDFGFTVGLSSKDIRLCLEESEQLGVPMIVGSAVRQLLTLTKSKFGPDADLTMLIKPIEEWAGVEVAGAKARA